METHGLYHIIGRGKSVEIADGTRETDMAHALSKTEGPSKRPKPAYQSESGIELLTLEETDLS